MSDTSCQLYLITPRVADAGAFAPILTAALVAGPVACVLLRLAGSDGAAAKTALKPLIAVVRAHDAAALLENDTRLVGHCDADGVHLTAVSDDLDAALRSMKPARIVGCGGFASRDDAMMAGESGADYVMFGDEADPDAFDARLERVAWWAEIFEVPCVACAASLDEVEALAATGVEFVALGRAIWDDPRGPAAAMQDATQSLRDGSAVAAARMAERA